MSSQIRAGDLRDEIRFETATRTQGTDGSITDTWAAYATVRAWIQPLIGVEFWAARAINERQHVRIRCRYLSGLDTDKRIVDVATNEVYDIISILNLNRRNIDLEILAFIRNDETA